MAGTRITQLDPNAMPGRRYGDFTNKTFGPHPVGIITQLTPGAWPGQRYGDFSGRAAAAGDAGVFIPIYRARRR